MTQSINDLKLAALRDWASVSNLDINTLWHQYLVDATGLPQALDIPTLELAWLASLGYTSGTIQDRLTQYLTSLGYTGDINAQLMAWYAHLMPQASVVEGADFDGTNDYLLRGANLTGVTDGKAGTFSGWFRLDGGDGASLTAIMNGAASATCGLRIHRNASSRWQVQGRSPADALILVMSSNTLFTQDTEYVHVLMSWDLAQAKGHVYINDVNDLLAGPTLTNDTIDYADTNWGVGAETDGGAKFDGCMAAVWFSTTYLDITVEANRRKFILENGKPARPVGMTPALYLSIDGGAAAATFATNRGSGGNLSITGSLDLASTSPSD